MPKCGDLMIFVTTTDNRQTKPIALPLAHVCGVIIWNNARQIPYSLDQDTTLD